MTVKAPFNFVPVSDIVFTPDWADKISHDIPFSDGESGEIELTITAKTPIYVRNGHTSQERADVTPEFLSFSNINSKHFIPATSLKGTIRNALEIISFSKMKMDKNMKFATRDWTNDTLYDLKQDQKHIHCGWLFFDGDNIKVKDCGKPKRINHKRLDEFFLSNDLAVKFEEFFSELNGIDITNQYIHNKIEYDPKTSVFKYALINYDIELLKNVSFENDDDYIDEFHPNRVKINGSLDSEKGTIVFTGTPDKWVFPRNDIQSAGKFYEFIFPEVENPPKLQIKSVDFEHFKFFHSDSPDWKFWSEKLNKGDEIPIFFRIEGVNIDKKIKDFGLAFLYKVPFKYSPYDRLPDRHKIQTPDLAECIFGYTTPKKTLKGRVQFGHAFVVRTETKLDTEEEVRVVLGSPKASYYPIYVNQPKAIAERYMTYSSEYAKISGWKRYPVRAGLWNLHTGDDKIDTKFVPLSTGSIFKSKILFHNLKTAEIGALLSALTFHNSSGYFHLIGLAKPYGYGKVQIDILLSKTLKFELQDYLCAFEEQMVEDSTAFNGSLGWHVSEQVKQFFTLCYDFDQAGSDLLYQYMSLDPKGVNEFEDAKLIMDYLKKYSTLRSKTCEPKSIYGEVMEKVRAIRMEEERKKENANTVKQEEERLADIKRIEKEIEDERLAIQKKKEEKSMKASSIGLDLKNLDFKDKKAWDELKKIVSKYATDIHKISNYDKIVKENPNGVLPETEYSKVIEMCKKIYSNLSKSNQAIWLKPYKDNPILRKVAEWIGVENATKLLIFD